MATLKQLHTDYTSLGGKLPIKAFSSKAKLEAAIKDLMPPPTRIERSLTKLERAKLRRYVRKNNLNLHPHGARWSSHDVTPEVLALIAA
jgi:hypothetical protein